MITYVQGNLFDSPAQVLTNTINCVGVMGSGVALAFKKRHPDLFEDYKQRCARGEIKPDIPYLWENDRVQVLNFPTKRHWKDASQLDDIERGLKYLSTHYEKMGIYSLAMPALGCGAGGLRWADVQPLIEKYLSDIPDLEVFVYPPKAQEISKDPSKDSDQKKLSHPRKIAALPSNS